LAEFSGIPKQNVKNERNYKNPKEKSVADTTDIMSPGF
jgi:hypothetical protein